LAGIFSDTESNHIGRYSWSHTKLQETVTLAIFPK
jgi:hypothetical protein